MRTRFSNHLCPRATRPVSDAELAANEREFARTNRRATRRLTLALAASAPLCAGALWAGPAQAAPTVESDENGPLVQILRPGYNDVLKGQYRILIQVTARKYNPQSVEMFIDDNAATKTPLELSSFASSSYNFDTRLLTDGRHKLKVRVTDAQGFRGWSEVTVFVNNKGVVDTQAPDLRFTGIEQFQELSGSIQLEVNAADNFGVKMLQILVSPADKPNKPAYAWMMMGQPPYRVNLDTINKNIPDGLYVAKALAWDSLDQQGEASPITFGIVNNQINATRVQDMLEGQRQMQKAVRVEKLDAPSNPVNERKIPIEPPVEVLPAATPIAPPKIETPPVVDPVKTPASTIDEAATARVSIPPTQERIVIEPPSAPSLTAEKQPRVSLPGLDTALQTPANPGIQLPPLPAIATPQDTTPRPVPQSGTPGTNEIAPPETNAATGVESGAEIAPPENNAATGVESGAEITPPETNAATGVESGAEITPPGTNAATGAEIAPVEITSNPNSSGATVASQTPATPGAQTVEIVPPRDDEKLLTLNGNGGEAVGKRNGGEPSLSRAAAIESAITVPGGAIIERARGSQPIAVARFSQPNLTGRNIIDAPVLSQGTSAEARLSNAELLRLRSNKRILNAARPLVTADASVPVRARALQASVPTLGQRPILSRVVTADSISGPAPKLVRQTQNANAPQKSAQPALSGSLSKTVMSARRLAPIAPQIPAKTAAPAAISNATRGLISKAIITSQRARPIEIAPVRVALTPPIAKDNAAPQMSALNQPRMSESASGLGVPARVASVERSVVKAQKTLDNQRVVALPRPGAATANRSASASGASIVASPISGPFAITEGSVLPVPTSYRAQRNTSLRAVVARYGLPVELVAISNGLTLDAKITSGTEIKLPRPLEVSYNGAPVTGDAPSMLMGDTAVTAFRFMFEKTGGTMEWDAKNQRVIARKEGREITLTIGSNVAKVGERDVAMEIAAFLFQGRTMVPLRFFEEGLNAQVEWNPQTGRLVVAMAGGF